MMVVVFKVFKSICCNTQEWVQKYLYSVQCWSHTVSEDYKTLLEFMLVLLQCNSVLLLLLLYCSCHTNICCSLLHRVQRVQKSFPGSYYHRHISCACLHTRCYVRIVERKVESFLVLKIAIHEILYFILTMQNIHKVCVCIVILYLPA